MNDISKREPVQIRAEDINPRWNWGRALPALGTMGVDFEERVDYRRLHKYRIGRARQALEKSDLGALLVFDVNNIRYLTSTKIGEWERDKLSRWALLTRNSPDPILWDFGSAAVHHKLYSPWLLPENCKAGLVGLTKSVAKELGSRNILCNAVAPGFISTDMTDAMTPEARAALTGEIPLERLGAVQDVAGAVCWLASDLAAYVTGQVVVVDGGLAA